jgi:hypothetical protein
MVVSRDRSIALFLVALSLCLLAALPAVAGAAVAPPLVRFGDFGSGAGQLGINEPNGGLAADPASGHVFVADHLNNRIDEFTAWGQFVKAWGWGVDDGSAALQTCGPAEPELRPERSLCRAGISGNGPGQLQRPDGIAIGAGGDVFVFEGSADVASVETPSQRVQVFSPGGEFLRMFGGGVDHTTGANVCTQADVASGDECGAGSEGSGPSEFSAVRVDPLMSGDFIDVAPDGTVYVADQGRIQEFDESGVFAGQISFASIHAAEPAFPEDQPPGTLAVDPVSGDIYLGFRVPRISQGAVPTFATWRITPAGAVVAPAPLFSTSSAASEPLAVEGVATDADGNLYASVDSINESQTPVRFPHVTELGPAAETLGSCCQVSGHLEALGALATDVVTAAGGVDAYVLRGRLEPTPLASIEAVGPPPDKWPPPVVPPEIEAQFPSSVGESSAKLNAEINPNFWSDTHYYLEYGTGVCAAGGCPNKAPTPPGMHLESGLVSEPVATEAIELSGLQPDVTYHFRFVAESGGGGPVFGRDPDGEGPEEATFAKGREGSFTTLTPVAPPAGGCPNEGFRTGPSASLEDCRAYEMVSPVDKNGGDILAQGNISGFPARLDQGAPDGEAITYSSYRSFGDAESASFTTQYIAQREAEGWRTHAISPQLNAPPLLGTGLDSAFEAFTEDLSSGWLNQDYAATLAPGAVEGRPNLYRRDNLAASYETITTSAPVGAPQEGPLLEVNGFSANAKRTVFVAQAKLTSNASSDPTIFQVYESFKGTVRLVSELPGGGAAGVNSTAGSTPGVKEIAGGRGTSLEHAVSEEGTRIYWSEAEGEQKLYVRVNGTKTRPVSSGSANFWAATPSGSQALYTEGGKLRLYDFQSEASSTLAETVQGVVGDSEDLSRVYFIATGALAGNAQLGEPNLFLYEAGRPLTYVATLSGDDFVPEAGGSNPPSIEAVQPWKRIAQVNPSGAALVFMSRTALTDAENADVNGKPDAEVFRYDAADHRLNCISCSLTGARSSGAQWTGRGGSTKNSGYWFASKIPSWEFSLHAPRVISQDGDRVFFDTYNSLSASDTNEAQDVYSWEAPGTGKCSEANSRYRGTWGGCVSLISSGTFRQDAEIVDASSGGRDVFFLTGASLVAADPGQLDLYDAREGGGFAEPAKPLACEGESCQATSGTPGGVANASESFVGPGNPRRKQSCRKGFVRRGGKCVHKHHKRKHQNHKRQRHGDHRSGGSGR